MADRPLRPLEWRPRHDAFAAAARALRCASPQGPAPEAVASLAAALRLHARYEEDVLWPRYAEVAPDDGPGSVRALHRDHRLLGAHLAHADAADPLVRAWSLARLEHTLEHHDQREATHVLPALERLGVAIDLDEPPIEHAVLAPRAGPDGTTPQSWPEALTALALGRPCALPPVPEDHRKVQKHLAAYRAAVDLAAGADRSTARTALVDAFDRALDLAWCAGQGREPWARSLRALSRADPTTRP